jgi:putative tryptophan/tyrosine transport system substrate-binding protein
MNDPQPEGHLASYIGRRKFLATLGGAAAAWPLAARGQQPTKKMPRIGWLVTGSPASYRFSLAAFREGLRALNYVEGENITIEYRWAHGDVGRLSELAKELVQQKVDIILAGGSIGAKVAKDATLVIPIVAAGAGEGLVDWGLVKSLAQPGGNVTGFSATFAKTASKRIQILEEIMPGAKQAAILWNQSPAELQEAKESASVLQLAFTLYESRTLPELDAALLAIAELRPDLVAVLNDPFMFTHRKKIADALGTARLPAIYGLREYVDDGGLISYGPSISDTYRRAAGYVDKILKGAKPAELPVQQPTKFELVINVRAAKTLGLQIPDKLLALADEVIE